MNVRKIYPISKIDNGDTKIELNCRTVKPVLLYFEERYGRKRMEEFICDTKMNLEYLEDKNNWVSYSYWCRLLAKLVEYTGDPKVPFIVGTYTTKKECEEFYGALGRVVSRLGTPGAAYKFIVEIAPRYTKMIGTLKMLDLKKNSCSISANYNKYKQDKNNCLNLQGILASVPVLWNLPLAKVKEVQCAAEGADSCIYKVSWHNRPSHLFGVLGLLAGLIVSLVIKTFLWREGNIYILMGIPVLGYSLGRIRDHRLALKESIDFSEKESGDVMESLKTIEKLNIELQEKVEQRTKELHDSNEKLQKTLHELRMSQDQLIQSEKMASVGRLAAGMAHELNNPVGAIRNYIQDVLEDMPMDDPRYECMKRAEKATGRCKRLVGDLLTFSRESKELKLVDINEIVEDVVMNAREEMTNPNIKILKELKPNLSMIRVDSMQIQQVFMNMIINAGDAIKGEGEIVVKTCGTPENVSVEISDTGEGISEEIKDKIFDPFFTTKAPGKRKGLGLAISYNIVKRFNGDIQIRSEKDKGTTFTITLPVDDETTGGG